VTATIPTPTRVGLLSVHTSPLEQPGTGDSGGMNVAILQLARRLAAAAVEVEVFTRAAGSDLPPTLDTGDGVRVHHLPAGPPRLAKADLASHLCAFYLAFAGHPAAVGLDVLHGHYWMSGWVGRQASRRLGIPLVQSFHTLARVKNAARGPGDAPEPLLRVAAEDRIVADAHAVIAPTSEEAATLQHAYRAPGGRVHVVEPGVDLDVFHPDGDRLADRQALGGGRIVLFAGRLQPLKAPDMAVRTLAALDAILGDDPVPARLVIVGGPSGDPTGPAAPDGLQALARSLGVADRVAVLAPRPQAELAALYRAADAVLVPSRSESFGLVALEAQACGTPVVASTAGGLVHAVGPGAGTMVSERRPEAFAAALAPYLTDPRVRAAAGAAGVRRAARASWDRTAQSTMDVYQAACWQPAARRRGA
jgi:D-inositol-3-phosphate glycosyltransferase